MAMCSQLQSFIFASWEPLWHCQDSARTRGEQRCLAEQLRGSSALSDAVSPQGTAVTQKAELVLVLAVCWLTWRGRAGPGLSQQCPWKCFSSGAAGAEAQCCGNSSRVPVFHGDQQILQQEWGARLILMCPSWSGGHSLHTGSPQEFCLVMEHVQPRALRFIPQLWQSAAPGWDGWVVAEKHGLPGLKRRKSCQGLFNFSLPLLPFG